MRYLLLLLLVIGCRCGDKVVPVSDCGKPCFPGGGQPVGACSYGTWACQDDGGMTCEGAQTSMPEECNGVDDDCDGTIDDLIESSPRICDNECGLGVEQCFNGRWTTCSAPKPQPEVCNGKDDDCDGKVDEIETLPDGGYQLVACFDAAPPANPYFGACRPGTLRCIAGKESCHGQMLPLPEVCDGQDNDCDGEVDEGAPRIALADIVIVFDNSGSMADVAANLKLAASNWVGKYQPMDGGTTDLRFALISAPHVDNSMYQCRPQRDSNFVDAMAFQAVLAAQNGSTGSGEEATLDALEGILTNSFGLSWRPGAKRVIVVFSDEDPQAYYPGCFGTNTYQMNLTVLGRLMAGGTVLHVFTRTSAWQPWLTLANAGGGQTWNIAAGAAVMESQLDSIIQGATCGP